MHMSCTLPICTMIYCAFWMNVGLLCMHVGILCMHVDTACSMNATDMLEMLCL